MFASSPFRLKRSQLAWRVTHDMSSYLDLVDLHRGQTQFKLKSDLQ